MITALVDVWSATAGWVGGHVLLASIPLDVFVYLATSRATRAVLSRRQAP